MDIIDNNEPESRVRGGRGRLASIALLGAGVIAGGTLATLGVANAGSTSSTATPTPTSTPKAPGLHGGFGQGRGRGPGMGMGGREIHGTDTIRTGTNTYATIDSQRGTVTANDGTTLSVKSADGFTANYAFGSSSIIVKGGAKVTIADLKVGDTVELRATVQSSGNPVVIVVRDGIPKFGGPGNGERNFGGPAGGPGNMPGQGGGPAPMPSASPSSGV